MSDILNGEVFGLSNKAYHDMHDSWSSTALKYMHSNSPFHFKAKYIDRTLPPDEPTKQMHLGSMDHSLILTPLDFDKEFFVMPDVDRRTKEGKAIALEAETKAEGRTIVSESERQLALAIQMHVLQNPHASRLLRGGRPEVSYFWQCPFSNLRFRSKVDYVTDGYFVELKTTKSANPRDFERHAYNLHYDLSAFHYREGMRILGLAERKPCYFIVVETEAPYAVQVFEADDSFFESGHSKWLDAVTKLEAGVKHNQWPGYFVGFDEGELPKLSAPSWARNKDASN